MEKGLPAYSQIALLDTRFVEYQHACIGTIQTTLNAWTIFVTFYLNFNMPLNDPSLLTALKAHIQIGGTPQVNTFQATFHFQMASRVQNHSLDILVPGQDNAGDALLIDVDSNVTPTYTYVPRQLSQDELVKLLPEKWITNYEQIHQALVRLTSALEFARHENSLVEIKFSSSKPKSDNVFPTGIHMITPTDQEHHQEVKHIWWDVCNCESCLDKAVKIDDDDEDLPRKRKSSPQKLKRRYEKGDPTVGLLGEPSEKFNYYVLYPKAEPSQPPSLHKPPSPPHKLSPYNQKALSILHQNSPTKDKEVILPPVFPITKDLSCSYSQEYEQEFPALTTFEHLIQQSISPEAFMSIIYSEFVGSRWEHTSHAREEFLKMKCCSYRKKDLEKHYDRVSQRLYCLNGVDDVNLKQVFLNSFPESLGNEAYRALEARNVTIAQTSLGELRTNHDWKIKNPTTIGPTGHANTISPTEATLNWQSENAVAQNKVLVKILSQESMITNSQDYLSSRVRSLESIINELRFKIQELHREIIQIIRTSPTTQHFSSISQKEAEMKNLKNQLQNLERQHKQKRITSLIDDPWRLPSTPFVGISFDPQSLPQSYTHTTSPSLNIWASKQRRLKPPAIKEPTFLQESQSITDVATSTKTPDVLSIKKLNHVSMFLNSLTQIDKPQKSLFIALVIKPQMDYEEFDNAECNTPKNACRSRIPGVAVLTVDRRRLPEKWRRVTESDLGDRIDRSEGNNFGFAGKSPPEKISGGGSVAAGRWRPAMAGGSRRLLG
uniref:Putative zinc finger, CCHC-type n=1 Tax=Tanacetum cinerariifolium TaxID=118510 RepID=A0A6L2NFW2_TANCI|nr:putative zinc finger, CCHC-type [Tanacetum cinerariifolium]